MQAPSELVDIGVNLSNARFKDDIENVLQRALDSGVSQCIAIGTCLSSSEVVAKLCDQYHDQFPNMLHCTAGIHPHDAKTFNNNTINTLRELASLPQTKAIGETGLDFNRNFSTPSDQEKAFAAQLELAAELKLPVFMHERDAHKRQFEIIKHYRDHLVNGVIHCFTGDKKSLFNYLDLNLHIGITGWICDERRGEELQSIVKNIPHNRLMIETDAPYLLPRTAKPKPNPKKGRNEPAYLSWVLQSLAEYHGSELDVVAAATTETARQFFKL
jgi:TatD DNase family protein